MRSDLAFAMGEAAQGNEQMVFDWDKAARMIVERKPQEASAGLHSDWEWTGGTIYTNGLPDMKSYTYLASTWATPEIDMDGDVYPCFVMAIKTLWGAKTKWPASALKILKGRTNE